MTAPHSAFPPMSDDYDPWYQWLRHSRHGDDAALQQIVQGEVVEYVNRLLDAISWRSDMTLLDVGTGEGAVAFRAIERVGSALHAVFTDISPKLLRYAKDKALQTGVAEQCSFLLRSADALTDIPSGSIDVVTSRAALAYVSNKSGALDEFFRVLKPGGQISIAEPIFQDEALELVFATDWLARHAEAGSSPLPLLLRWRAAQWPDTLEKLQVNALMNYSERDLWKLFDACGFVGLHMELHFDMRAVPAISWESFLRSSPHPLSPPAGVILAEKFSPGESACIEAILRPVIEAGNSKATVRLAYLSATKPEFQLNR